MASAAQLAQVESEVASLATQVDLLGGRLETEERTMQSLLVDLDMLWVLLGSILVFFMQCGFALVEAGSVRVGNTKNILLKNVMDACIGALVWWAVGFSFAYGVDGAAANAFIGGNNFFLGNESMNSSNAFWAFWLFQWAFSATAATIVSGAVAERCEFIGYIVYTTVLTAFIYPVVAHWGWSSEGWLSPSVSPPTLGANGLLDFAGSGIVHMCGGGASLMAAYFIGPRVGRFNVDGSVNDMPGHSSVLATMGTFFLWFGWYGFNPVSTLKFQGMMTVATKAAVNTTLSGSAAGCIALIVHVLRGNHTDIAPALNGILSGLVAISGGCALVEPYIAFLIGLVAGVVYYFCADFLKKLKIDDPLDATSVHLACGLWGVISIGLFANKADTCALQYAACETDYGLFYGGGVKQFGVQLLGAASILAWSITTSGILFYVLNRLGKLRVSLEDEERGLDVSHHGGAAYHMNHNSKKQDVSVAPAPF